MANSKKSLVPKEKNKKNASGKSKEKSKKNAKENKARKKLTLYNKPNSTRNTLTLNLKLSTNFGDNISINKSINKNTNININQSNDKISIFRIEKIPKIKNSSVHNNPNDILIKNANNSYYSYLDFDFPNGQERDLYAGEYLEEIYLNLLIEENNSTLKPTFGYMDMQNEINEQMRAILIDWIIEVHFQFNLRQETLYMTIYIIDTYLSFNFISRKKLQLLGITCLLISCKSQEIYFPHQSKFLEVTDGAYNKEEMLTMENEILKKLNFKILFPTSNDFYNVLSKLYNFEKKQYFLGKYFIESVLIDYKMIKYSGSIISAASTYLVMKYYGISGYQKLYSKYIVKEDNPENAIKDTAREIYSLIEKLAKTRYKAVKNKYALPKFESVSENL
jgi:cyclin B